MSRIKYDVLVHHTRHILHTRILALYLLEVATLREVGTFEPPDVREQETDSEERRACEWLNYSELKLE